ncbi:MAG: hypothetical protein C4575_10630 [Desulforudis sp.]|nr:MAG: hypothetical protein C4575_10630 [Desulforudis sp.]
MDKNFVYWIVGIIVTAIFGIWGVAAAYKKKQPKMKKLSADERIQKISEILCYGHRFIGDLKSCAFIFMPNGDNIFGAGWVNMEWLELLENFVKKNGDVKLAPTAVGEEFYLTDLITGINIRIPLHPVKGMFIDKDGVILGHMYIFTKY